MTAGRNHGAAKRESLPLDLEIARPSETAMTEKNVHAQRREALHSIVGAEVRPQASQTFHNGAEIDVQVTTVVHPITARVPHLSPGGGATQQRLTRDTAVIETVPAHEVSFDQGHTCSQASRTSRSDESGRAGTDDHQV